MKHYMSYDAKGRLVGIHSFGHAQMKLGGWPDDRLLEDASSEHEHVVNMRTKELNGPNGAVEFIAYDCPCDPTLQRCNCAGTKSATARVIDGKLVDKKVGAIVIGGSPFSNGGVIKRPPGTKVDLRVVSTDAADESMFNVFQSASVALMDMEGNGPLELAFTKGTSPVFSVIAPAQGLTGGLRIFGDDLAPIVVYVRGWSA